MPCRSTLFLSGFVALLFFAGLAIVATNSAANDSAASTAAGGIILKREPRISMEKERLSISLQKVSVEYEFRNETDTDITTEVAFPVPPYTYVFDDPGGPRSFDDFRLWVDDQPAQYSTQVRALVGGKDFASLLSSMKIDVQAFGHFDYDDEKLSKYDVTKLAKKDQEQLAHLGLIAADDGKPLWTVDKAYHWKQLFPARKILRIRHQCSPAWGWSDTLLPDLAAAAIEGEPRKTLPDSWLAARSIQDSCIDSSLRERVIKDSKSNQSSPDFFVLFWVDYILTTANSWKTPIKDFELVVERPDASLAKKMRIGADKWYVSFCWPGPIQKPDADHFVAHASDFVPHNELHVAFFGVTPAKADQPGPQRR
jgi:hypothetical protein